jgi:hypothetical protein
MKFQALMKHCAVDCAPHPWCKVRRRNPGDQPIGGQGCGEVGTPEAFSGSSDCGRSEGGLLFLP